MFPSLLDAKAPVEEYRNHYHRERPHSALGYRIPAEFAAACDVDCAQQTLRRS
jgi:transposase InsO family protein